MPVSFFVSNEKALDPGRYRIGQDNKKNFGKLRPIERSIDRAFEQGSVDQRQKQDLHTLCSTVRSWMSRSLSHKHRFKGVELYQAMGQMADTVWALRQNKDYPVLKHLQDSLNKSIGGLQTDYEALTQGQGILSQFICVIWR